MADVRVVSGIDMDELQSQLNITKPGDRVILDLAAPRDMTDEELTTFQKELEGYGLKFLAPVTIGKSDISDNTIRLDFINPSVQSPASYGMLPLVIMIIAAAGAIGLGALAGWRLTDIIRDNFPIILFGTIAAVVGIVWISSRSSKPMGVSLGYRGTQSSIKL